MIPGLAVMGLSAGTSALANLAGRHKNTMPDPNQYRDKLVLGDADIGGIRSEHLNRLVRMNMGTQQNIKQYGGANRMPAGAIMSGLGNSSYHLARGANEIETPLQQMKLDSERKFAGMQMDYKQGQNEADQANRQMWGSTIGDLGKVAMLWSGGLLGGEGADANTATNTVNSGIGVGKTDYARNALYSMMGRK